MTFNLKEAKERLAKENPIEFLAGIKPAYAESVEEIERLRDALLRERFNQIYCNCSDYNKAMDRAEKQLKEEGYL